MYLGKSQIFVVMDILAWYTINILTDMNEKYLVLFIQKAGREFRRVTYE